jgi:AcrR family transcriptional regulator
MVAQATAVEPPTAPAPTPSVDAELLDAARRALERHGLARTTLERIAEEAGLSRVTLYRRGLTREAILAALADGILESYREALWPALTARGTGAERLRHALGALCEVAERRLGLLLALGERVGAALESGGGGAGLGGRGFTEPLERLLRDGAADGSLREVDARETAPALLNVALWTYVHLRAGSRWNARRARRVTLDLALRGVAVPPRAPSR